MNTTNQTAVEAVAEKLINEVPTISAEDAKYFAQALLAFVADNKPVSH